MMFSEARSAKVIYFSRSSPTVTDQVPPGMVWMAFHFHENCANWLTNPVYDPKTQTAEYKACAVQIHKLG
jgi:predicted molibdopterin-dependent oxidoreductase YjgC